MKLLITILGLLLSFNCFAIEQDKIDRLSRFIFNPLEYTQRLSRFIFIQDIYEDLGYKQTKKWIKDYDFKNHVIWDLNITMRKNKKENQQNVKKIALEILEEIRDEDLKCGRAFN